MPTNKTSRIVSIPCCVGDCFATALSLPHALPPTKKKSDNLAACNLLQFPSFFFCFLILQRFFFFFKPSVFFPVGNTLPDWEEKRRKRLKAGHIYTYCPVRRNKQTIGVLRRFVYEFYGTWKETNDAAGPWNIGLYSGHLVTVCRHHWVFPFRTFIYFIWIARVMRGKYKTGGGILVEKKTEWKKPIWCSFAWVNFARLGVGGTVGNEMLICVHSSKVTLVLFQPWLPWNNARKTIQPVRKYRRAHHTAACSRPQHTWNRGPNKDSPLSISYSVLMVNETRPISRLFKWDGWVILLLNKKGKEFYTLAKTPGAIGITFTLALPVSLRSL